MCSRAPSAPGNRPEVSSPKHSPSACLCASARETSGEPPLAGVDLGSNHTHDLLLHLRLLGVDVGISYLAILIPAHTEIWVDICSVFHLQMLRFQPTSPANFFSFKRFMWFVFKSKGLSLQIKVH